MITISLCMIVKNEEHTLQNCLNSVKDLVDEIIIVDTGSTDRTKQVAKGFTDKIYDFKWIDDFSAARNFSYSHATMDYILWLDADDVITSDQVLKFKQLKQNFPKHIDAVMMKYNTVFDSQGNVTFSYFRERLSKRDCNFKWHEPVHEYLSVGANRLTTDISITHTNSDNTHSDRNIKIYEQRLSNGDTLSARGMYYYARELKTHNKYDDAVIWFNKFLDSNIGWVEDNITACSELAKCALSQNKPDDALNYMLRSFTYDTPRAEICCQLAYYFKRQYKFIQAIFWFKLALSLEKKQDNWGFRLEDCWGYIPCIELAVCYDKLGDYKQAEQYNDMASEYKPNSQAILFNKEYFANKKNLTDK